MLRTHEQSTEGTVREIRRRTRRKFSSEEKIGIALEGLRGEQGAVELCRLALVLGALRPDIVGDETVVFSSSTGGHMSSGNFRRREFRKLVTAAFGLTRKLTPHALRHTWASLHLARGSNLKWVQETGGWSSAKMLLDVYGHFLKSESSGYADALTPVDGPQAAPTPVAATNVARPIRATHRTTKRKMEPTIRLERTTCSLRVSCSTS